MSLLEFLNNFWTIVALSIAAATYLVTCVFRHKALRISATPGWGLTLSVGLSLALLFAPAFLFISEMGMFAAGDFGFYVPAWVALPFLLSPGVLGGLAAFAVTVPNHPAIQLWPRTFIRVIRVIRG